MFTDAMIDQMRREVENPEIMKARIERENPANEFITNTKKMFLEDGRDFDKEFEEWQKNNNK